MRSSKSSLGPVDGRAAYQHLMISRGPNWWVYFGIWCNTALYHTCLLPRIPIPLINATRMGGYLLLPIRMANVFTFSRRRFIVCTSSGSYCHPQPPPCLNLSGTYPSKSFKALNLHSCPTCHVEWVMQVLPDRMRPPTKMNFTVPSSMSLMAVFASLRSILLRKELGKIISIFSFQEHGSRFLPHGVYGEWIMSSEMTDYIIHDFRCAPPNKAHTRKISFYTIRHQTDTKYLCEDIPKLYHVVFLNSGFMILNNKLEIVKESAVLGN